MKQAWERDEKELFYQALVPASVVPAICMRANVTRFVGCAPPRPKTIQIDRGLDHDVAKTHFVIPLLHSESDLGPNHG